jgi:protein O-GlcNAc transferase
LEKQLSQVEKYYNKGLDALDAGNWLLAVQRFNRCIELDPKYALAYHELADIYYHNEQYDAALSVLIDALMLDPKDSESSFALASVYMAQNKFLEALRVLKRLEQEAPEFSPELYYNMGVCYKSLFYPDYAMDYLKLALEEDPSYFECIEVMGKLHFDAGKFDEAKKSFKEVLDADPGNIEAHHMLGVIYSKEMDLDAAIKEWETVNSSPNSDDALRTLALTSISDAQALKKTKDKKESKEK